MAVTVLESIATGNPPRRCSQQEAASFMQQIEGLSDPIRNRLPAIYERSGIDYRYSAVDDYGRSPEEFTFYPQNWALAPAPTTADRNAQYREAVIPLATDVATRALHKANLAPDEVTHVIAVSCTGFFAPGLDIEIVKRLGLAPSTQRTMIGFMGCYAAFNALRVAHSFCQSDANARVLVVCAELCTLHFQVDDSLESAVVNAIFSDGAAAAVLSALPSDEARGGLAYRSSHTHLHEDSMDHMTWDIGNTGFLMGLSSDVPRVIARDLPAYLDALLKPQNLAPDDVDFWAIHPGGRAIVERAQETLGLPAEAVKDSLEVLRQYGNMSSPTIFFVLQRILQRHHNGHPADTGVAMAFGPGLTLEGCLFTRVS